MKFIKQTHDVLGLENRVKVNLTTVGVKQSKIGAMNSFYLTDGTSKWYLHRRPAESETLMWVTLKKEFTGDPVIDDTLSGKTATEADEILCKVTASTQTTDMPVTNIFNQGNGKGVWGCYGGCNIKIEAMRSTTITGCGFNLKPAGYENNTPSVHVTCHRGVRGVSSDHENPADGNLTLTFPV